MNKMLKGRALESLSGHWWLTMGVIAIAGAASLICSIIYNVCTASLQIAMSNLVTEFAAQTISMQAYIEGYSNLSAQLMPYSFITIVGGVVSAGLGLAVVNFLLVSARTKQATFSDFKGFINYFGKSLVLYLLMAVKIALWSLLLVVPGIIKAFAYSMAPYILAEHPEKSASECIKESIAIMDGCKGSLFGLYFSFIGWALLCGIATSIVRAIGAQILPGGGQYIVNVIADFAFTLPLYAYVETTIAHFYLERTKVEETQKPADETPFADFGATPNA